MTGFRNVGGRALLAATAFAMVVAGCGGSSSETTTAAPTTEAPAATTAAPETTAAPAATTAAPDTTAAPETTAPAGDDDMFARGEDLFLVSAGGVGCKTCHGLEARGDVGVGPNIQGKTVSAIKTQLQENELMEYMRASLTQEDIEAVALYLAYLKDTYGTE
jgi:hypothetical protein